MADELRSAGVCTVTFNPEETRTDMRADAYSSEDPSTVRPPSEAARSLLAARGEPVHRALRSSVRFVESPLTAYRSPLR